MTRTFPSASPRPGDATRLRRVFSPRALLLACLPLAGLAGVAAATAAEDPLWAAHVEPVLRERCVECHSALKSKSGLDLTSLQTILRGGDRGAAVIPGRPEESNLYKFLSADSDPHMPPGKRTPLTPDEVEFIRKWIQQLPGATAKAGEATAHAAVSAEARPAPKPRLSWKPRPKLPPEQAIDHFLELAWKLDQVTPARVIDDRAFVRRLYLDLAGRLPTFSEGTNFLQQPARDRRRRLVESLVDGPEYPRRLRDVFDPVLMGRRGPEWEETRARQKWFAFLEDAFRSNRPWNEVVHELVLARPARPEDAGAVCFVFERQNNAQAVAEALAPVVFGLQMKCAQCHDHMVAREIKQAHYWAMVAAFNRSKNVETPAGPAVAESAIGGFVSFANLKKESQPARLTFFNGRNIDEAWPKEGEKQIDEPSLYLVPPGAPKSATVAVPKFSRRGALADAVTRDNPLLARAMVNRIWALLFGRGLVHPVDLMDSKHLPSHPELLDWLAADFAQSGYDVKRLVRTLCLTRAYQLDSRVPAGAKSKPPPPESFARGLDKPLSAEQLLGALLVATEQPRDAQGRIAGRPEAEVRRAFVAQFPDLFPPEYNASAAQALFLSNSPLFEQLLVPSAGNLTARLVAVTESETRVREAFRAVLGREPEADERRECLAYLQARGRETGVRQLVWALVTSGEFQINH